MQNSYYYYDSIHELYVGTRQYILAVKTNKYIDDVNSEQEV